MSKKNVQLAVSIVAILVGAVLLLNREPACEVPVEEVPVVVIDDTTSAELPSDTPPVEPVAVDEETLEEESIIVLED